ncbi:MAG: zinc ABC transporter substrate-binding protein [Planctomycetales bacterium]|nr:zinc ABC transporter substrate-binding protein [Planctomycetales bacterium]
MLRRVSRRTFLLAATAAATAAAPARRAMAQESPRGDFLLCSTTQTADFARQVVGDRLQVRCVLAPGEDPHLYQLKPRDASVAGQSLLCVQNGWHLEGKEWMETLAANANKRLVTCVEGAKPLELDEEGEQVRDPHAWFSPANAAMYVRNITRAVSELQPQHRREFEARASLYLTQLRTLDQWIKRQVEQVPQQRRVLVTSHDAFNYFCRDYGFQSAAPAGWSTGQELGAGATPGRRREVVDSIRSFRVPAIFVETSVNPELIREIANDAGVKVGGKLYSDSMGGPGTAGETYLGMMRENVLTIVSALGDS